MDLAQREVAADVVNSSVLTAAAAKLPGGSRPLEASVSGNGIDYKSQVLCQAHTCKLGSVIVAACMPFMLVCIERGRDRIMHDFVCSRPACLTSVFDHLLGAGL